MRWKNTQPQLIFIDNFSVPQSSGASSSCVCDHTR